MNARSTDVEHNSMQTLQSVEHIYQGGEEERRNGSNKIHAPLPVFVSALDRPLPMAVDLVLPKSIFDTINQSELEESVKLRAYYFAHLVFRGPKNDNGKYTKKNRGKPAFLLAKALEDVIPPRAKAQIFKLLIPEYIEQSKGYKPGKRSKTYSFTTTVQLIPYRVTVREEELVEKICIGTEKGWKRQIDSHPRGTTYAKLYADLKEVHAPLKALGVFVAEIEKVIAEGRSHLGLEAMLMRLLDGRMTWRISDNGRLYTSLLNYPEIVRAHFLIRDRLSVEIDLSNSHPALLTQFAHDAGERAKLSALTSQSKFYAEFECFWDFDREKVWDEGKHGCRSFKTLIQKIINGAPRPDLRTYQELCKEFPRLMATLASYKSKAGNDGFARELQGREADLIYAIVDRVPNIPCFTAYDGIAVPMEYREQVEAIFRDVTREHLGFELKTKVKVDPTDYPHPERSNTYE